MYKLLYIKKQKIVLNNLISKADEFCIHNVKIIVKFPEIFILVLNS